MKKGLIALLFMFVCLLVGTYFLPAGPVTLTKSVSVHQSIAYRSFTQPNLLSKWRPNSNFLQTVEPRMFYEVLATVNDKGTKATGPVRFLGIANDSTVLQWTVPVPKSPTPWGRAAAYFSRQRLTDSISAILDRFENFLQKPENVYGVTISRATVTDTLLLVSKATFPAYPTAADYYPLIQRLKDRAATAGVQTVNYPMLNIYRFNPTQYEVTVALPINKVVPDAGPVQFKRMVAGNILIAEVQGGHRRIDEALLQMEQYVADHRLKPPAIPFQSLVTDRMTQPDSTQWRTKLYFPIY